MPIERTRRRFLTLLCALPVLASQWVWGRERTSPGEDDYVVVNGWILKRSDVTNR